MKLATHIALACLATGVYSSVNQAPARVVRSPPSLVERDLATVTSILSSVSDGLGSLDTAIKGFSGDLGPVRGAAEKLVAALRSGKSKVDGSSDLSLADALGLQSPVTQLQSKGQALTDDLKTRRSAIAKAGLCGVARQEITDINTASQGLIKSVVSKVPKEAQAIAENLASGLTKVLGEAQDAFSPNNCKNSGGGGGESMTASASSSSTPSVSASTTSTSARVSASSGSTYWQPSTGKQTSTGTGPAVSSAPYPTGDQSSAIGLPSGGLTATGVPTAMPSSPPPLTAGGAVAAPAGALAMVMAAFLM